jgi:hypothetical protein
MQRVSFALLALVLTGAVPSSVEAGSVLFSGTGAGDEGVNLSASALFTVDGSTLKITLQNTGDSSGNGKDVPGNQLSGVFFDLPSGVTLTPVSAAVAPGAVVQASSCSTGLCNGATTNVGGEFAYNTSNNSWDGNHQGSHGVSGSGYIGLNVGNMGGPNLDGTEAPNGPNFGIIADNNAFKPNGGLAGVPLIKKEVVFALAMTKNGQAYSGLELAQISNVSFQYGTGFGQPSFSGGGGDGSQVPEPMTLLLVAPAAALVVRRRLKSKVSQ